MIRLYLLLFFCLLLLCGGGRYNKYAGYSSYISEEDSHDSGLLASIPADGGFETDLGFVVHQTPDASARSTTRAYQGSYSWYYLTNSANQGVRTDNFTVTDATTYTVSCYYYTEQGSFRMQEVGSVAAFGQTFSETGAWTYAEIQFVTSGAGNMQFIFRGGTTVSEVYVDNIKVTSP